MCVIHTFARTITHTQMNQETLREALSLPADKAIETLKTKAVAVPRWSELVKHYDHRQHAVMHDQTALKDKPRSDGSIDKSTRTALAIEKLASRRMADFTFAIPVKRIYTGAEDEAQRADVIRAIEGVYKHARVDAVNLRRAKALFACCEVCSVWYVKEQPNNLYGFPATHKLRCKYYSPMQGYELYPLLDDMDDMLAMSFAYDRLEGGEKVAHFETFTDTKYYHWVSRGKDWTLLAPPADIKLGKIPAIYMHRSEPIYADITELRSDLEYLLSRNGNILAYNSAPILKVKGEVMGREQRDEVQRIFRTTEGGDVDYVGWTQSVDASRLQAETLHSSIFRLLQIPDLSFESMKGLGNIGYDARQTLLTDVHLRVGSESGDILEALEREANILKAFLKLMNPSWTTVLDQLEIEHIITPYIQGDELGEIRKRITANGGKPIESQRESIARFGWSADPDETLRQIQEEQLAEAEAQRIELLEGAR